MTDLMMSSLHFFHYFNFSVLHLLLFLFLSLPPLLFPPLFLNSPPFRLMASAFKGAWGPFPGCFHLGF